jgi:hypothetical protein
LGLGRGLGLDLDKLLGDLFGGIQGWADQIQIDGADGASGLDGLGQLDLSGLLAELDIQGLIDQLLAELGDINLPEIVGEVSSQVKPVMDAAIACASNATELAEPAQACMRSIMGDEEMGMDMDMGLWGMGGGRGDGPGDGRLRRLLHRGRGLLDPATLCTAECTAFLDLAATTCPDLANLALNGTDVRDACSGVEPELQPELQPGQPIEVLEPLPEKPVADPAQAPDSSDALPVLIPVVQQSGSTFVAGEATESSSASVAGTAAGVALTAMMTLAALS